ncbi:MAG: molybdenum cofactor cytidylyltransferase [Chloroflexi bacterium]|nr:molybdenum cofactor cytidylyltransferase [Chloroflexota bacterium]
MISAIILAAGESKRMGRLKQLLPLEGKTLIERTVDTVLASAVDETIVVLGHQAEAIEPLLKDRPVKMVLNRRYREGMSASLKAGLESVSSSSEAVLMVLADQPGLTADIIDRLLAAYRQKKGGVITPVYRGRRGNPVLIDIKYRPELMKLTGDVGARQLVAAHPEDVYEVEAGSDAILQDIDTEEDLQRHLP